jgi:hypothetical protein
MTMLDWEVRLNRFLAATDREVLQDVGKVTAEVARAHAESEFEKDRIVQDRLFESDFDRVVAETKRLAEGTPRKGKKPCPPRGTTPRRSTVPHPAAPCGLTCAVLAAPAPRSRPPRSARLAPTWALARPAPRSSPGITALASQTSAAPSRKIRPRC